MDLQRATDLVDDQGGGGNDPCIFPAHVDDIKGAAIRAAAASQFYNFNKHVDNCIAEWRSFLHIGIQHEH